MTLGIQGLRGTGQFDEHHRPRNYRELFTMLEPNGTAPFNALLAMTGSEATDDPEYRNFVDELPDRTFLVDNGAGYDANATTLPVDAIPAVGFVVEGSIIVNANTGEVMQATALGDGGTGTITVKRNIGGTALTISDNDELVIAGYAAKEGDNSPEAVSFDADVTFNYTQIFRTSYTVTNTLKATNLRTGDKEDEAQMKALKMHMSDIERAFLFGKRHIENPNSAQPTRYTGGLLSQISTVIDAAGTSNTITEEEFDKHLMDTVFAYGSTEKMCFVGPTVAQHLQQWAKDRWTVEQVDGTYGVNVTRYKTFAGDLIVKLHPMFRQIKGLADTMIALDFSYIKYRYLDGRDTQLLKDRQGNDADAVKHEYLTECGVEMLQDKVHSVFKNWQLRA